METIETIRKEIEDFETLRVGKRNDAEYLQGMLARIKTLVDNHKEHSPENGPLQYKGETDYELIQPKATKFSIPQQCWVSVRGFAVYINPSDEGVSVEIYKNGDETSEPLASTCAMNSDLEESDEENEGEAGSSDRLQGIPAPEEANEADEGAA